MRTRLAAHSRQVLIGSLIALFLVLPDIAAALPAGDPIGAAWERARAAGTYRFTADIVQTSAPEASVASIGQQGKQERLRMEGRTDLPHGTMAFTLWSGGGSAADPASGIEVKVEDERAFMRQAGQPWQEMGDFRGTLAPGGDFLAFLAAARDVTFQGRESRDGLALTRYSFVLDGPRFAEAMRLQSERLLIARGELLPGARLEPSPTYTKMTGSGEIWIGDDGLPYRQALAMQFPAADGRQISPSAPPFVASLGGLRAALAAWENRFAPGDGDIWAARISATGVPVAGSAIAVARGDGEQTAPQVAYEPSAGRALLVYRDGAALRGRFIAFYRGDLSNLEGALTPGTTVYVQVDSANTETDYGNVLEEDEAAGEEYNNIRSGVVTDRPATAGLQELPSPTPAPAVGKKPLPPRPEN